MQKKEYFDESMSYGNLRRALNRAAANVRWKDSVTGYELHAAQNTMKNMRAIRNGTYKLSPYQVFTIHEPKEREIGAQLAAIGLELNEKTTMYPLKQGVKFLQWRFILTESGKIVQKMSSAKMGRQRRRLKKLLRRELNGEIPEGTAENSLQAWKANAARGDTYYQQRRMTEFYYSEKARIKNGKYLTETAEGRAGRAERAGVRDAEPGRDRLQRHDGQHRGPV